MGARRCYLCDRKERRLASYALHKFPKDKKIADLWKVSCGLRMEDNVTNLRICSLHFRKDDGIGWDSKHLGSRLCLKPDAVPSLFNEADIKKAHELKRCQTQEILEIPMHIDTSTDSNGITIIEHIYKMEENESSGNDLKAHVPNETTEASNVAKESNIMFKGETSPPENDRTSTPRRGIYAEPRYIGDLSPSHLQTPSLVKRTICMVKDRFQRKSHQLRVAQQQNRRLKKRLKKMEELIQQLKMNNTLSEETTATLMKNLRS